MPIWIQDFSPHPWSVESCVAFVRTFGDQSTITGQYPFCTHCKFFCRSHHPPLLSHVGKIRCCKSSWEHGQLEPRIVAEANELDGLDNVSPELTFLTCFANSGTKFCTPSMFAKIKLSLISSFGEFLLTYLLTTCVYSASFHAITNLNFEWNIRCTIAATSEPIHNLDVANCNRKFSAGVPFSSSPG